MRAITKTFLTGLATVFPVVVTLYILFWLAAGAEHFLGGIIRFLTPARFYRPGMGVAAGIAVIFLVGILMKAWVVQILFEWMDRAVLRIPLIKSVYGSIRDFVQFVSGSGKKDEASQQVVMVGLGDTGMEVMGFVTRREFNDLPAGIGSEGTVAVYLPMSYQIGGYTVLVDRSRLRPVDISKERAMRFAITAGMSTRIPSPAANRQRTGKRRP